MFRIFPILLLVLSLAPLAWGQKFQWVKQGGGAGFDEGSSLCVDAAGNSYVIGTFSDTAQFGDFTVTPTSLVIDFSKDAVFMAKYDLKGQEIWARKISDSNLDFGNDIEVDSLGNLYVSGGFSGTVQFGNTTLISSGYGDMFFAKYDTNGNFIWAKRGGGSSFTVANNIALDGKGNSYVTGYFRASAAFGNFRLTSSGRDDAFLVKYDSNGNVLWAKNAGGNAITGSAVGTNAVVTPAGDCYLTGFFYSSVTFDAITLPGSNNQELKKNVFLAKYDTEGNVRWANQIDNPEEDIPGGLAVDAAGNCYAIGSFIGSATFGSISLTSHGAEDAFVAKYDPAGKALWARNIGGPDSDKGIDLTYQKGKIFLTGTFSNSVIFQDTVLTSKGAADLFITQWNEIGQEIFTVPAGGAAQDNVRKIALDSTGNAYVAGSFEATSYFGAISIISQGSLDVFVAKFGQPYSEPNSKPSITIQSFAEFNYCAGPVVYVPFRTSGFFEADNSFVAQLSDAAGSFASPVIIGTGSTSPLLATIPANTMAGSGYRIRVVAVSPAISSNASETALNIFPLGLGAAIPNIITPNNDGLNDTFALALSCQKVDLKVYNRWGKLVYEQAEYQNTWNGANLPEGTYYYQLHSSNGLSWKGWVEISH
ncbi:T9SS type B sorting domain-containing protein [Adhaeribacter radiodurans]|uniref:Gliding motility-associated C-terminal domain-containing protein n=1 Tax=Adhaeribacter radiodurans TaxID=2745197 RepID=A0A7L7L3X0_9BACT|nr:gliding motility-associated C-terminal domain-containing protein [Adhaeribacter radiodurans]QMU27512.1 gliding motility-associated C-terminal domain-containing protein [Adhaeribacter radiodurans]